MGTSRDKRYYAPPTLIPHGYDVISKSLAAASRRPDRSKASWESGPLQSAEPVRRAESGRSEPAQWHCQPKLIARSNTGP